MFTTIEFYNIFSFFLDSESSMEYDDISLMEEKEMLQRAIQDEDIEELEG